MEMEELEGGSILSSGNISLTKYGEQMGGEGRGQCWNECTFMLLCYDMNSERVVLALNVCIMSRELVCMHV